MALCCLCKRHTSSISTASQTSVALCCLCRPRQTAVSTAPLLCWTSPKPADGAAGRCLAPAFMQSSQKPLQVAALLSRPTPAHFHSSQLMLLVAVVCYDQCLCLTGSSRQCVQLPSTGASTAQVSNFCCTGLVVTLKLCMLPRQSMEWTLKVWLPGPAAAGAMPS